MSDLDLDAIEMSTSKVRENFSAVIDSLRMSGDRVVLTQYGRSVAALIDMEDLELLQRVEDSDDVAAVRRQIKDRGETVSLAELRGSRRRTPGSSASRRPAAAKRVK